ncbi:MAG: hypothetical protein AUK35_05735 [Zetaproteobacteria bacterium CG2_30_46_52]|nr:MAG: hypothetical protein AUK35_05735 [Zetaproteobacteria bacterium CG2_30_46_52]
MFCLLAGICFFSATASADRSTAMFNQLKLYAEIAHAAYLPKNEAQVIVETEGYKLVDYGNVPGVEVNYFIAANDKLKHQIITVRGTANVENAMVDISLKLSPDKHANIALHQGFSEAAEGIYKALLPKLNKDYTISTTGHSLGGAVAVVLAMFLDKDQYRLGPVVTFGQPKVTNVSGAQAFSHLDISRVVTSLDLVPLVPPLDVMDINNIDIYWHLGKEIVLLHDNDYALLEGIKSMLRSAKVINTTPTEENLDDHRMSGYLQHVIRRTQAAMLVPYETGIDLRDLFGI